MYNIPWMWMGLLLSTAAYAVVDVGDPTRPYDVKFEETVSKVALDSLQLNSVISSDGRKVAIINNQAYQIGEEVVDGYKLLEIQRSHVVLRGPGGNLQLSFPILEKTSVEKKVGDKP